MKHVNTYVQKHVIVTGLNWKQSIREVYFSLLRSSVLFPVNQIIKQDISSLGSNVLNILIIHNFPQKCKNMKSLNRMRYDITTFTLISYYYIYLYMGGRLLIGRTGQVAGIWYLVGAMAEKYSFSQNFIIFLKIGQVSTWLFIFVVYFFS